MKSTGSWQPTAPLSSRSGVASTLAQADHSLQSFTTFHAMLSGVPVSLRKQSSKTTTSRMSISSTAMMRLRSLLVVSSLKSRKRRSKRLRRPQLLSLQQLRLRVCMSVQKSERHWKTSSNRSRKRIDYLRQGSASVASAWSWLGLRKITSKWKSSRTNIKDQNSPTFQKFEKRIIE
jgi:hypothetical protein